MQGFRRKRKIDVIASQYKSPHISAMLRTGTLIRVQDITAGRFKSIVFRHSRPGPENGAANPDMSGAATDSLNIIMAHAHGQAVQLG